MNRKVKRVVSFTDYGEALFCAYISCFVLYDPRFMMDWERHDMSLESVMSCRTEQCFLKSWIL